ncbi:MAG: hypothetical protein GX221_02490 [Candidatus Riflebacteria bacterium]|nr:hypothetical protein [Candidatus Riflebacteria bacterium]
MKRKLRSISLVVLLLMMTFTLTGCAQVIGFIENIVGVVANVAGRLDGFLGRVIEAAPRFISNAVNVVNSVRGVAQSIAQNPDLPGGITRGAARVDDFLDNVAGRIPGGVANAVDIVQSARGGLRNIASDLNEYEAELAAKRREAELREAQRAEPARTGNRTGTNERFQFETGGATADPFSDRVVQPRRQSDRNGAQSRPITQDRSRTNRSTNRTSNRNSGRTQTQRPEVIVEEPAQPTVRDLRPDELTAPKDMSIQNTRRAPAMDEIDRFYEMGD